MTYINEDMGKLYVINGCSLGHFYKKTFLTNIDCSLGHFYKKNSHKFRLLFGTLI